MVNSSDSIYRQRLKFPRTVYQGMASAVPHQARRWSGLQPLSTSAGKAAAIACAGTARLKPCPDTLSALHAQFIMPPRLAFAGAVLALLCLVLCFLSVPLAPCGDLQPLDLRYQLHLLRPTTHLMDLEIDVARVQEATLNFVMPAWAPGRYAVYDFAKNVQEFQATGARDQ